MKLVIMGDYPRDPCRLQGGVEAVIVYLIQGLRQFADLDIHVVTLREDVPQLTVENHTGVRAYYVPADYRLANLTFFLRNKLRLKRVLQAIQPDLIHAHIAGMYSEVAFSLKRPAVLTPHGIRHRETKLQRGWINRWVRYPLRLREERVGIQVADHLIAISPYIEQEFAPIIRGRVHLIENPISDSFFQIPNREQPRRILFTGYLNSRKGVFDLIRAFARLRQRWPDVQLHLAGRATNEGIPGYFEAVQAFIQDQHLEDGLTFLGQLDEPALLKEYAECAILALPSYQETAPMAIQQAMAAGKPVVSTRVGGIPYLVSPEQTGLLVEPGDVQGLAEALDRLLSDHALRQKMGQTAQAEAWRRFRAIEVARQTRRVYDEILNSAPVAQP